MAAIHGSVRACEYAIAIVPSLPSPPDQGGRQVTVAGRMAGGWRWVRRRERRMDGRWAGEAEAVLTGFKEWRLAHPQATLTEIEAALDARLAVAAGAAAGGRGAGLGGGGLRRAAAGRARAARTCGAGDGAARAGDAAPDDDARAAGHPAPPSTRSAPPAGRRFPPWMRKWACCRAR